MQSSGPVSALVGAGCSNNHSLLRMFRVMLAATSCTLFHHKPACCCSICVLPSAIALSLQSPHNALHLSSSRIFCTKTVIFERISQVTPFPRSLHISNIMNTHSSFHIILILILTTKFCALLALDRRHLWVPVICVAEQLALTYVTVDRGILS